MNLRAPIVTEQGTIHVENFDRTKALKKVTNLQLIEWLLELADRKKTPTTAEVSTEDNNQDKQ